MHVIRKKTASDRVTKISLAPPRAQTPHYLTVAEVASLLRLSRKTIYNMVSQRRIPFRKAGGHLLFDHDEIKAWTKAGTDNQ